MKNIHELLKELGACNPAQEWASDKTWEEIYNTCHRGDWLCWLFAKTNPKDLQLLTLVKGHQTNTVRHLMKDERSLAAVDAAIAFGEGKISLEELNTAAYAANDATKAAANDATKAANDTAKAAAYYATKAANDAANAAAYYATYYAAYYAASYAAKATDNADTVCTDNQQLTADIFRQFISIDKFNI